MDNPHHHPHIPQSNSHRSVPSPTLPTPRFTLPKAALRRTRFLALSVLVIYILFPTQFIALIASHPAFTSLSDAGRKVLASLAIIPDQPVVSIVAACRNRHTSLQHVLPTWLASQMVREIILIDWNSQPPLRNILQNTPHLPNHSRLKLVRVQNESSWVLSRAYNLAVNLSTSPIILRIDCDYVLQPNILRVHNMSTLDHSFYAGNWQLARDQAEVHLNGALLVSRRHFLAVGGYDERIQTYGWDDDDLYTRLQQAHLTKLNISYDYVEHVEHDDSVRAQQGVKFAQVQIDVNRLLLEKLPQWTAAMYAVNASRYQIVCQKCAEIGANYMQLKATRVPHPLRFLLSTYDYDQVWTLALGRRLADDHGVPWDVMATMSHQLREQLLTQLSQMQSRIDAQPVSTDGMSGLRKVRIIIIHCVGPLSARLHALASAIFFAKKTSRVPIIVWELDSVVDVAFGDLFETSNLVVLHEFQPKWPFDNIADYDGAWRDFEFYNLIEGEIEANPSAYIVDDNSKQLYIKSDHAIEAPSLSLSSTEGTSACEVRYLLPQKDIRYCLQDLQRKGLWSAVGVHVYVEAQVQTQTQTQMDEVNARDSKNYFERRRDPELSQRNDTSRAITICRDMARMLNNTNSKFYIVADSAHILRYVRSKFKANVLDSSRPECDHEHNIVKGQLIDILALSQCRRWLYPESDNFLESLRKSKADENSHVVKGCTVDSDAT